MGIEDRFRRDMKAAREAAGLSQRALAELIGTDAPAVSLIEQGKRTLTLARAAQIADVLDIPLLTVQRPMPAAFKPVWEKIVAAHQDLRQAQLRSDAEIGAQREVLLTSIAELQQLAGLAATLTPDDAATRAARR